MVINKFGLFFGTKEGEGSAEVYINEPRAKQESQNQTNGYENVGN